MDYKTLRFEIAESIATITLDREDSPANALNARMAEELFDVGVRCGAPDVRAVIVTASGKMFCGGGDLAEMDAAPDKPAHLTRMATLLHAGLIRLAWIDAPVIMAVNGTAGGGGFSMVLSGDYVIASEKAKFVSAYTSSGLTPDGSSTYYLAKHVGLLRAKELMLTNRVLTATEAQDWGLVNKVVPPETVVDEDASVWRCETATGHGLFRWVGNPVGSGNTVYLRHDAHARWPRRDRGLSGQGNTPV
jgi:2-(1,2-epoxy-1,2-dihydrophenyl)acetyl-CoA isomerase